MEYKFKDDIKQLIFDKGRHTQGALINDSFNQRDELNEVYAKAEAFDEYHEIVLEYINDEDDNPYKQLGKLLEVYYGYESGDSE